MLLLFIIKCCYRQAVFFFIGIHYVQLYGTSWSSVDWVHGLTREYVLVRASVHTNVLGPYLLRKLVCLFSIVLQFVY